MTHRVYRLSISPEDFPEVRRVVDLDGRDSLGDLDRLIVELFDLDPECMYGFFLSGRYWDKDSAYWDPRSDGRNAERALLFRLGLTEGKTFVYLSNFAVEERFTVTVVAVTEVAEPLPDAVVVESVGELPTTDGEPVDDTEPEDQPAKLNELVALAEQFLDLNDQLDGQDEALENAVAGEPGELNDLLRANTQAALALLHAIAGDGSLLTELDDWLLERTLKGRLLELPMSLMQAGEPTLAIEVAPLLVIIHREWAEGHLAVALALAGQREAALSQLEANLANAEDAALVETKAGDTHSALGDLPAAEAYYRRAVVESKIPAERGEALVRVARCLWEQGRESEAREVLQQARELKAAAEAKAKANPPAVGRNEPCPCGSGKKYKKCHGAST